MNRIKEKKHNIAVLLAVIMLLAGFAGCRQSPVLQDVEYTQDASEVDYDQQMLDPDDYGEEDEQFEKEETESAETPRDTDDELAAQDKDKPSEADNSIDLDYSANEHNDQTSNDSPTQTAEPTAGEQPEESTETQIVEENRSGGIGTSKEVVDGTGRTVTVPENVESVTAVGMATQIVGALGGGGKLKGTDSDTFTGISGEAFGNSLAAEKWWEGNGSSGISSAAFEKLLEAKPEVCFELSGQNTFSDSQAEQLEAAGIAYVVLPGMTSVDDLKHTVSLVGQVLGGDCEGAADSYNAWVDSVVNDVSSRTNGVELTSLYISDYDDAAQYQLNNTMGVIETNGSGLAAAYSPSKNQLVSAFMKAAGVANESTRIQSRYRETEKVYVTPMFHQFDAVVSGNMASFNSGAGVMGSAYDLFVARMVTDSSYIQLGSSSYPAVVVSGDDVKSKLESDWFWQYHETDQNGYITVSGQTFYCGVIGNYDIYVNPSGMGDWAEGSAESPLEAYWIAYRFSNAYSLDEVKQKARDFYQRFYGFTVSDSQLKDIFGE